jgi:hypothetical protein
MNKLILIARLAPPLKQSLPRKSKHRSAAIATIAVDDALRRATVMHNAMTQMYRKRRCLTRTQ